MVEEFNILLTNFRLSTVLDIPVEDIFTVIGGILLQIRSERPKASFDESDLHILIGFELDCKPDIALVIQFVDKLDQRTTLDEFIAHLILDVCEEMEKIVDIDLFIPQNVPERASQGGFIPEQRLQGYFIDLFEAVTIHIWKVLYLHFFNEILVCLREKHFANSTVIIDMKLLDWMLGLNNLVGCAFIYEFVSL